MGKIAYADIIKAANTFCKKGILNISNPHKLHSIFLKGDIVNIYALIKYENEYYYLVGAHDNVDGIINTAKLRVLLESPNFDFDFYLPFDYEEFIDSIKIEDTHNDYLIKFRFFQTTDVSLLEDNYYNKAYKGRLSLMSPQE